MYTLCQNDTNWRVSIFHQPLNFYQSAIKRMEREMYIPYLYIDIQRDVYTLSVDRVYESLFPYI